MKLGGGLHELASGSRAQELLREEEGTAPITGADIPCRRVPGRCANSAHAAEPTCTLFSKAASSAAGPRPLNAWPQARKPDNGLLHVRRFPPRNVAPRHACP